MHRRLFSTGRYLDYKDKTHSRAGLTAEELEEIKRAELEAKMKKEATERAELEKQEAEEAEVRRKRHEEWVCMPDGLERAEGFYALLVILSRSIECAEIVYKGCSQIGKSLPSLPLSALVCMGPCSLSCNVDDHSQN